MRRDAMITRQHRRTPVRAVLVTVISLVGYIFGRDWSTLVRGVKEIELAVLVLAAAGFLMWRHWNTKRSEPGSTKDAG